MMGSFLSPGKNEYYWRLLEFLQDENVYDNDRRVLPFTPSRLQDYTDLFPDLFNPFPKTTLSVFINDQLAGLGTLNDPSGLLVVPIPVPLGEFTLEVRDDVGTVINREFYVSKNYATFFEIAAQGYEERRVQLEQVREDVDYETIRSDRVFPVVGIYFGFPPPPGWTNEQYRDAILGNLPKGCPGFRRSFFHGGTQKGVVDTIKSITCDDVVIEPIDGGDRWTVFDDASEPTVTDPADPDVWVVSDADDVPPANHRVVVYNDTFLANAVVVKVSGALRSVIAEEVFRETASFIESSLAEPYVLSGTTLVFSIEDLSDDHSKLTFTTTFGVVTTAADAVTAILTQNPSLTTAVHAASGKLRIGTDPEFGKTKRITIEAGSALSVLGFIAGQTADTKPDQLANPNIQGALTLMFGSTTFVDGVDFTFDAETGEILWASQPPEVLGIPDQGQTFVATYDYLMKREIESMANKVKEVGTILEFEYV